MGVVEAAVAVTVAGADVAVAVTRVGSCNPIWLLRSPILSPAIWQVVPCTGKCNTTTLRSEAEYKRKVSTRGLSLSVYLAEP